jgi:hypothetical protein
MAPSGSVPRGNPRGDRRHHSTRFSMQLLQIRVALKRARGRSLTRSRGRESPSRSSYVSIGARSAPLLTLIDASAPAPTSSSSRSATITRPLPRRARVVRVLAARGAAPSRPWGPQAYEAYPRRDRAAIRTPTTLCSHSTPGGSQCAILRSLPTSRGAVRDDDRPRPNAEIWPGLQRSRH